MNASQLNRGADFITDPREKESLCRLNLLAASKAKASVAYSSARDFLARAAAYMSEDSWSTRYERTFALFLDLSECEYLVTIFSGRMSSPTSSSPTPAPIWIAPGSRPALKLYLVSGRYGDAVNSMIGGRTSTCTFRNQTPR